MPTGCDGVVGGERSHYAWEFVGIRAPLITRGREHETRKREREHAQLCMYKVHRGIVDLKIESKPTSQCLTRMQLFANARFVLGRKRAAFIHTTSTNHVGSLTCPNPSLKRTWYHDRIS